MANQNNGAVPERVDFSKIKTSIPIPNLIEVQKKSYERFLQMDQLPNEREDIGLQTVFSSVFPISDFRGVSDLEFVDYSIGNWETITRSVPLMMKVPLSVINGISPKKTSCSLISRTLFFWVSGSFEYTVRRMVTFSGAA